MAKVQFVLLSVMNALIIALLIYYVIPYPFSLYNDFQMAFVVLYLAFFVISIISIFKSSKLIKQHDEEKLKKSARLVKFGVIIFLILMFISWKGSKLWGVDLLILFLFVYMVFLGSSVFSIAYIRLLYKEKGLSFRKAVIFTIAQFVFGLDIITTMYLVYFFKGKETEIKEDGKRKEEGEKNKKSVREILRFYLGTYTPPEFLGVAIASFKSGPIPVAAKKTGAFFSDQFKNHRVRIGIIIAILCLIPIGFYAFKFYQSRLPQLISVGYRIQTPDTTGDPEARSQLMVSFFGSAAPLEMKDN